MLSSHPVLVQFFHDVGGYRKPDQESFGTFHGSDLLDPGLHSLQHWQGRLISEVRKAQGDLHIPNCSQIRLHCLFCSANLTAK